MTHAMPHLFKMLGARAMVALMLLLAGAAATGCGTASQHAMSTQTSAQERLSKLRVALGQIEASPFAKDVPNEIEQARSWVQRAESLLAQPPDQRELLPLMLDALRGQLAQIQAQYAQLEAEADLRARKSTYQDQVRQRTRMRNALGTPAQENPQ